MQCVVASPLVEWRERQHSGDEADQIVHAPRLEERAMRAVVHDDESSNEESGRERSDRDGE